MRAPIYQLEDMGSSVNSEQEKNKSGTIEDEMSKTETSNKVSAAEKKRLNTKTKDTEAKTVKQGKLSRKEAVKKAKNKAKGTRDDKINALGKYQENLPEGISRKKKARATKRQEMQDIRNEERGARRADRAARKIKRIGDRNNMTVGEATKAYEARYGKGGALSDFQKGERNTKPTDAQLNNDQKGKDVKEQNDQIQIDNVTATIGNNTPDINNPKIKDGKDFKPSMLDSPSQQEASEDSQGISSFMMNSKNRRGY